MTLKECGEFVKEALALNDVRIYGDPDTMVEKAAICTGSGKSMISDVLAKGADDEDHRNNYQEHAHHAQPHIGSHQEAALAGFDFRLRDLAEHQEGAEQNHKNPENKVIHFLNAFHCFPSPLFSCSNGLSTER